MGDAIIPKKLGLWGNLVPGVTLFFYVGLIDSISFLRNWVQGPCIYLMKEGKIYFKALKRNYLSEHIWIVWRANMVFRTTWFFELRGF